MRTRAPTLRPLLLGALVLVSVLWLPWDLHGVFNGSSWQLSLGLSIKLFFTVMAVWGLILDRPFGFIFLLAISGQSLLIDYGTISALWPVWDGTWEGDLFGSLAVAVTDSVFRVICCVYGVVRLIPGTKGGMDRGN